MKAGTYFGQELVDRPKRLALMNLYLHGLEPQIKGGDSIYEVPDSRKFDLVLTNPPFGTKGANDVPNRDDFTIETTNKQLNFLQHVLSILKPGGRAAIVLPDNCLFADQAGEVFDILMKDCDVHTVLRLPNGTFSPYSPGTKTNVVFFTKGYETKTLWIYDARTNIPHITKKDRPLTPEHFTEFEACYGKDPNGTARLSIHPEVHADYIELYLRSPDVRRRFEGAMRGVAVRGINIGDVRALQIALPPYQEQVEIAQRVAALLKLADLIDKRVEAAGYRADKLTQRPRTA